MSRTRTIALTVVMLCGLVAGGSAILAQDATPLAGEVHPLVGSWLVDADSADPENPLALGVFTSDGVFFQMEPAENGTYGSVGTWEATGETTANLTFWSIESDGSMIVVRASIESPDGQSFTATYTLELVGPDGTSTGQIGPGMAEGTKLSSEPQGKPVGSSVEIFGEEEEEATPGSW